MDSLTYKRTNVYETADETLMTEIFDFAEGYKQFLDEGKTERECCAYVEAAAKAAGYEAFDFGRKLKAGDKIYYNNRGKNMYLIKVGTENIAKDGIRIIASHIDSQRSDGRYATKIMINGVLSQKTAYTYRELINKLYDFYFGIQNTTLENFYPIWVDYRKMNRP